MGPCGLLGKPPPFEGPGGLLPPLKLGLGPPLLKLLVLPSPLLLGESNLDGFFASSLGLSNRLGLLLALPVIGVFVLLPGKYIKLYSLQF